MMQYELSYFTDSNGKECLRIRADRAIISGSVSEQRLQQIAFNCFPGIEKINGCAHVVEAKKSDLSDWADVTPFVLSAVLTFLDLDPKDAIEVLGF